MRWHLVGEGKTADVVYCDLFKPFDTLACNILIDKLVKHGLGKLIVEWIENQLNSQFQMIAIGSSPVGGQSIYINEVVYHKGWQ